MCKSNKVNNDKQIKPETTYNVYLSESLNLNVSYIINTSCDLDPVSFYILRLHVNITVNEGDCI